MYEVYLEKSAEQDLKRLSADAFKRLINYIKALTKTPRPVECHKIVGSKSDWRIRVGNYRIIYEIDDKVKVVNVMRVRHRREVYR